MVLAEALGNGKALPAPPPDGLTVHLVGRLTPAVLSFLLPTIHALYAMGTRQALLFISDGAGHEQMMSVPSNVHRVPVRDSHSPHSRCASLYKALLGFSRQHRITAMHLHGLLPGLAAARLLRHGASCGAEVFFSPHSSRILDWPILKHAVFGRVRSAGAGTNAVPVICNVERDARLLTPFDGLAVRVIECPVPALFFDTPRNEADRPLLLSCNCESNRAAIDGFLRIAVLLNDDRLGIDFNWIGNANAEAAAALQAAGVRCFESSPEAARASRLSKAWIYVSAEERGFPIRLAEAMAAGVPCIALDTEIHRSMIVHGQTGYLFANRRELLERIGQLIDSQHLRHALGEAARQVAASRFGEEEFRRQLWRTVNPVCAPTTAARPAVCFYPESFSSDGPAAAPPYPDR